MNKVKYSRKRDAILHCLSCTTTHPTADWIFQQVRTEFPDMSLGTVYRNLSQCKQRGEIRSIGFVNGFERFDARLTPHDHLVCRICGRVQDLFKLPIPSNLDELAAALSGAEVEDHSLLFYGRCANCRSAASCD